MLIHTDLAHYYYNNFVMVQHSNITMTELENMVPFEKYLFLDMLIDEMEKKQEAQKNAAG